MDLCPRERDGGLEAGEGRGGRKKGRAYRHREARPMLSSDQIAALIPKCLDIVGREVKWSSIYPLVSSMASAFHGSCEGEPDLWIEGSPENELVWQLDPEKLSIVLLDGRRTLQFRFKAEGIDSEALKAYKKRYSTSLEDWVENCYTESWFNDSSANIQRLLREGGLVRKGSKRGWWISNSVPDHSGKSSGVGLVIEDQRRTAEVRIAERMITAARVNEIVAETSAALFRLPDITKKFEEESMKHYLKYVVEDKEREISAQVFPEPKEEEKKGSLIESRINRLRNVMHSRIGKLRDWRLKMASGKPAYMIFDDVVMERIAWDMPENEESLMKIKVIKKKKMESFGVELLEFLEEVISSENESGGDEILRSPRLQSTHLETSGS